MPKKAPSKQLKTLHELSTCAGLQIQYESTLGGNPIASPEAQVAVLQALGVGITNDLRNVFDLLKEARAKRARFLGPVTLAAEKSTKPLAQLCVPRKLEGRRAQITLTLEDGRRREFVHKLGLLHAVKKGEEVKALPLGGALPPGYHSLQVEVAGQVHSSTVVCYPRFAYQSPRVRQGSKLMGVFAPTYALRSKTNWGVGDLTDLSKLVSWVYKSDGDFVGTLPLLALFLDGPHSEISPYSPASRLFWNELYLDLPRADEWAAISGKIRGLDHRVAAARRAKEWVDYELVYALKKRALTLMAGEFFASHGDSRPEFRQFMKKNPLAGSYAQFRAVVDKRNSFWQKWPRRLQDGEVSASDYDEVVRRMHLYAQFLLSQQLGALSDGSDHRGLGIYLDFPVSVNPGSFDVWRERDSFALSATAGCPPDSMYIQGQNWGILPLHPYAIRENGYRYLRGCFESIMRYCGLLRLDHVMGFYRLYWVPRGMSAKDGVYVRYNCDELFAVLCLESQRQRCVLIGEDLGTVPPEVRAKMDEHRILRMLIHQGSLKADIKPGVSAEPENCIASMNTHDMPPFAAFWGCEDLKDQVRLKVISKQTCVEKTKAREKRLKGLVQWLERLRLLKRGRRGVREVMQACALWMARSPARLIQLNIEDLWLEHIRQNTPATAAERPNWKHKLKLSIEEIIKHKELSKFLRKVKRARE